MRTVQCPACNQHARVPNTDTALNVECPGCQKTFEVPASASAPPPPNGPRQTSRPPDSIQPPRGCQQRTSPDDRSRDDRETGRRPRARRTTFPVWQYTDTAASGMLVGSGLGLVLVIIRTLLTFALIASVTRGNVAFLFGAVCGSILPGLLLIPVGTGANNLSQRSSWGLALTGAIFAIIAGLIFGLGVGGVFALLEGPSGRAVLAAFMGLASGAVGLLLLGSGILAIVVLCNHKVRAEFPGAAPRPRCVRRDEDLRRSRRYEDDSRH